MPPIVNISSPKGKCLTRTRFGVLFLFLAVFLTVSFLTRAVLFVISVNELELTLGHFLGIFGIGAFFDIVTALYLCIPLILLLMFTPGRVLRTRLSQVFVLLGFSFGTYLVLFNAVSEYFFFEEFGTRFNFIAVDYLIYTQEVIDNIVQSYPLTPLLLSLFVLTIMITMAFLRRPILRSLESPSNWKTRLGAGALVLGLSGCGMVFVEQGWSNFSDNNYVNTLAENGMYDFVAAFRLNALDYCSFYPTEGTWAVFSRLRGLLKDPDATYVSSNPTDITRVLCEDAPEEHMNLVFIVEESLSGRFMAHFGNEEGLTPRFDELADKSLFFTRLYATGTRTTRGLEAITLSLPPTPGRSVVKRPNNENMYSISTVLRPRGYDMIFLYGGHGYFDNMNYFFTNNGFRKVDRMDLADDEVTFENAWGACDEDIFNRCLKEFDQTNAAGHPFCAVIMTTSNHRPYTYPEGKINIPSHTGRKGGVKYADFATGQFLDDAEDHPWFDNTVFVVVADHCAGSMGKHAIPVNRYHIPLFIYSPGHITPAEIGTLCSQMDVAPTALDLLEIEYHSRFFGKDIMEMQPEDGRALLGTHSRLGYYKDETLVILDLKNVSSTYRIDPNTFESSPTFPDRHLISEAISFYQGAAEEIAALQGGQPCISGIGDPG